MATVRNAALIYQRVPEKFLVPGDTTKYISSRQIDLNNVAISGGFLARILVLSSDPYLRGRMRDVNTKSYAPPLIPGEPIDNFGISVVIRSEDPTYQVGDYLYGFFSFEEYAICHASSAKIMTYTKIQKHLSIPWSIYVGTLGMPGQTAYMGWKEYLEDKAQRVETLFVSGGGGPVGSFVIQFAKLTNPNLKVIASAGSKEKVDFMRFVGADVAFNYKEQSTESVLDSEKPIDMYWDNVGGPVLDVALNHMAHDGYIVACGAISAYNGDKPGIKNYTEFFARSIKLFGFTCADLWPKYTAQFYAEVPTLVAESKIKYLEHRYEGLENAEQALLDVQTGGNFGKAVINVASE